MSSFDVLTLGALTYDVFVYSDAFRATKNVLTIPLGAKLVARDVVFATGGGAANAAVTFANLGFRVAVQGSVGHDDHGDIILRRLSRAGVGTHILRRDKSSSTGLSIILSTNIHERTVFVQRGASAHLTRKNLAWPSVSTRWLYITSLGGNLALLSFIANAARKTRTPFLVNPGSEELHHGKKLLRILRNAAIVVLNREEGNMALGIRRASPNALLQKLSAHLTGMVIITDGPSGAWCRVDNVGFHAETHKRVRVKERTGAGDAFGSGFLAGFLSSRGDVRTALQVATHNAEAVMQAIGAQNGLLHSFPKSRDFVPIHKLPTVFPLPAGAR